MVGNHVSVIDGTRCLGGSFWSVAVPLSRHFLTAALFGKFPSSPNGYPCGPQPKYESSANRKPGDISPALNSHAHALLVVLVHRSVRNLPFVDVTWLCQFSSICRIPGPKQLQESRSRWLVHSPRCRIFPPTLAMRVSGNKLRTRQSGGSLERTKIKIRKLCRCKEQKNINKFEKCEQAEKKFK